MLVYAIEEIAYMNPDNIEVESLESIDDLLAAMMSKSIELLNKNNFLNDYTPTIETSNRLRGKILIQKSYQNGSIAIDKIAYKYYKFNIDSYYNRIIKSATTVLLTYGTITNKSRRILNSLIEQFDRVSDIEVYEIDFQDIEYRELPFWYKPAMITSKLILDNLIGKDKAGEVMLYNLDDETRLCYIFERFVRNFYMEEYTGGVTTQPVYNTEVRNNELDMLVENNKVALVIDTKWYNSRNVKSNRVNNEREVWDYMTSYMENEEKEGRAISKEVHGVVLYGQTEANLDVLNRVQVRKDKYRIHEKTINLDQDFESIKNDLISLVDEFLV